MSIVEAGESICDSLDEGDVPSLSVTAEGTEAMSDVTPGATEIINVTPTPTP